MTDIESVYWLVFLVGALLVVVLSVLEAKLQHYTEQNNQLAQRVETLETIIREQSVANDLQRETNNVMADWVRRVSDQLLL